MTVDIEAMRRAAEAATQGEWTLFDSNGVRSIMLGRLRTQLEGGKQIVAWGGFDAADTCDRKKAANAAHIAAFCPANALALLDLLAAKDAEIAGIVAMIEAKRDEWEAKKTSAALKDTPLDDVDLYAIVGVRVCNQILAAIKGGKHA